MQQQQVHMGPTWNNGTMTTVVYGFSSFLCVHWILCPVFPLCSCAVHQQSAVRCNLRLWDDALECNL